MWVVVPLFIQPVFNEHLLCATQWGWGITDVRPALLELIHGFAQETERNKAMVTNGESSMMEEQVAELEKSIEGLHPSGTSLEEMGSR